MTWHEPENHRVQCLLRLVLLMAAMLPCACYAPTADHPETTASATGNSTATVGTSGGRLAASTSGSATTSTSASTAGSDVGSTATSTSGTSSSATASSSGSTGSTGTVTSEGFRGVCGPDEAAGLPPCCFENVSAYYSQDVPSCSGRIVSDGEVLTFNLTEYPDYGQPPTGTLVPFQLKMLVPAHYGATVSTCGNAMWGYEVLNIPDGGFEGFGTDGCDGEVLADGTWSPGGCGGFFSVSSGFSDCYPIPDGGLALYGVFADVGFWATSGPTRRYYDSHGSPDFRPLYFVVPP